MGTGIDDKKLFTLYLTDNQVIISDDDNDICYTLRKLYEECMK